MNSSITLSIPSGSSLSRSLLPSASSSSSCAKCMAGFLESGWWLFSFLNGKKLVGLGLDGPLAVWILGLQDNSSKSSFSASLWPLGNLNTSLPVVPPSGRLPSLSIVWEVCPRSDPSSVLLLYLGESGLERKLLIYANALKGRHPSLTLFLYQPPVTGIVLGLVHQAPSHCYNVIQNHQHIVQGYVSTRALHQLSRIALQRSNSIG